VFWHIGPKIYKFRLYQKAGIGYSKDMIKKIPTLFCKEGMVKMERYLQSYGIENITGYFIGRKNYFYFSLDK